MTTAPKCLLDARTLLLTHLRPHGLTAAAVGIVGDPAHRGGYHCGRDRLVSDDYSNRASRDKAGLSDYASALDIGSFAYGKHNLRTFSVWLVAECARGAADTKDIREVIYSPDGTNVKRWDRERRSSTGDSSHRWHTHISFYRDATKAGRDLRAVFARYLVFIGLIQAPAAPPEVPDVRNLIIAREKGSTAVFIGDGVTRRLVPAAELSGLQWWVGHRGGDKTVYEFTPGTIGVLGALPPVPVTNVTIDASGLAGNPAALAALAKAVNDDAARRLAS